MLDITNIKHHTNVWICLSQKTSAPLRRNCWNYGLHEWCWVKDWGNKKTNALHQSCTLAADHKTTGRGPFSKAKMVLLCMRSVFLTSVLIHLGDWKCEKSFRYIIWLIFVLLSGLDGGPGSQQPPPQGTPGIPQQQVQFRQPLPPGMHPRPGQVIKRKKILRDTSRFRTKPEFF